MKTLLLVAVAGGLGSAARYLVSLASVRWLGSGFPYGTLAVNVLGSFLIALVMQLSLRTQMMTPVTRIGLTSGFLGGFTTYSAFNYESLDLWTRGAWRSALANLSVTLVSCLVAGALGIWVAGLLIDR